MENTKLCAGCGNPLPKNRNKYCNRSCMSAGMSENYTKICKICGKAFPAVRTDNRTTCSKACSSENRSRSRAWSKGVVAASAAAPLRPLTGRFETHMHAKEWTIQSPAGDVYHCRNLLKWLRDHEDLISPSTPKQAFGGFSQMKRSAQGKTKFQHTSWHGWTLISFSE